MYLVAGRNPVVELLRSTIQCTGIYLEKEIKLDEKISEILETAQKRKIKLTYVSNSQLRQMFSDPEIPHQGVVADAAQFSPGLNITKAAEAKLENQIYLYIREALYEHNAAAIIRTAECMGVNGVIIPPQMKLTPNMARIAMGANFHLPIAQESLFNTIKLFHKNGYQTVAIEISGDKNLAAVNFRIPTLLIVGGEDRSISQEIIKQIDQLAVIPQFGRVNSLNMSVAASIALYEHLRQNSLDT